MPAQDDNQPHNYRFLFKMIRFLMKEGKEGYITTHDSIARIFYSIDALTLDMDMG